MTPVFLFPSPILGGTSSALATSGSQEAFLEQSDAPRGFAAEFERLAGRPCTQAELDLVAHLSDGCSVWAEGLVPEAFAHLAVALTSGTGQSVLFVSPALDLLEHRQLRLGTRAPCRLFREGHRQPTATSALTIWTTPDRLDPAHLARAFGPRGPDVIFIEDAQATTCHSFEYRPSFKKLAEIIARYPQTKIAASSIARGRELRARVGKELGIKAFSARTNPKRREVFEEVFTGPQGPILRVEKDPGAVIDAIVGPLPRPALVLCSTPAEADRVYAQLVNEQVPAHRMHSGLSPVERAKELVHFALPGRRAVMVAVSSFGPSSGFAGTGVLQGSAGRGVPDAFGHGYARRDLRSIVHLCAPCSLDQYSRELNLLATGLVAPGYVTADDDDANETSDEATPRSVALMLYDPTHLALNLSLLERKRPTPELARAVVSQLTKTAKGAAYPLFDLARDTGCSAAKLNSILEFLADQRLVDVRNDGALPLTSAAELERAGKQLEDALSSLSAGDGARLEEVEAYVFDEGCRMQALAGRLSWETEGPCGVCDVCAPETASEREPAIEHRSNRRRTPARAIVEGGQAEVDDGAFFVEDFLDNANSA